MFVPARYYGNPHSDNGSPDTQEAFYFVVEGPTYQGGRLSGYVTRKQFNWLADRLDTPKLPEGT
jgi:hypothetical protein